MIEREEWTPSDGLQLTIMPSVVGIIDRLLPLGSSRRIGRVLWVHGFRPGGDRCLVRGHAHLKDTVMRFVVERR
jgi:hypothetical protein